jgi:hypothetical protein
MTSRPQATRPVTLQNTFSFYLPPPKDLDVVREYGAVADAVVLKGPRGPKMAMSLRATGWIGPMLFDRAAYERRSAPVDAVGWFAEQAAAGADRILSPGRWVPWDQDGEGIYRAVDAELHIARSSPTATLVLAVDSRWLRKGLEHALAALSDVDRPVALVLAHRKDPLGPTGSVGGLLTLTRGVPDLTLLRCDHGAIGALAFGAAHGSIGLTPTYRHFVPPDADGGGIPDDRTPRVFVSDLMDWFAASKIAGWGTTQVDLVCHRACCRGADLVDFFDPRYEVRADVHNVTTIAGIADHVLGAPNEDKRRLWAGLCEKAIQLYGPMGKFSMVIQPAPQLREWAQIV